MWKSSDRIAQFCSCQMKTSSECFDSGVSIFRPYFVHTAAITVTRSANHHQDGGQHDQGREIGRGQEKGEKIPNLTAIVHVITNFLA